MSVPAVDKSSVGESGENYPQVVRPGFRLGDVLVDPPVVLAPMAAITHAPYRRICKEMGAGLVVTEMVYANQVVQQRKKAAELLDLGGDVGPVSVQLFGKDPEQFAEAARICESVGADAIDVNMGCPMRKVVSSGHGAALLREVGQVEAIIGAMSGAVKIPVTAKIRAGWVDTNAVEVARAIEGAGGAGVAVHGRTREEGYTGHADLGVIAAIKEAVSIPVMGNGDVVDVASARRMFSATGCDGVMIARGCLGNPWIFQEVAADVMGRATDTEGAPVPLGKPGRDGVWSASDVAELERVILRHLEYCLDTFGERRTSRQFRKQLMWYFRGTDAEAQVGVWIRSLETADDIRRVIASAIAVCA